MLFSQVGRPAKVRPAVGSAPASDFGRPAGLFSGFSQVAAHVLLDTHN
jgi:hypothetical protein